MKSILLVFCVLSFGFSFCQGFKILDAKTNKPVENVTILLDGTFVGYSNKKGYFDIKKDTKYDVVKLSHLSYETRIVKREDFNATLIYLNSKTEGLNEVAIKNKKKYSFRKAIYGGIGKTVFMQFVGKEIGVTFIPFEKDGKITALKYRLVDFLGVKGLKYLKFKANLYTIDSVSRLPDKKLIEEDIMTSNVNGRKFFSLDISDYDIEMPKEGVFVAFIVLPRGEYPETSVMSTKGMITATPALKAKMRKNNENRFSMRYRTVEDPTRTFYKWEWRKEKTYFYMMDLEVE